MTTVCSGGTGMNRYLRDKRVVIVGPSPSCANEGSIIDSYDIVVRFNRSIPLNRDPVHIGIRTDVLYTGLAEDVVIVEGKDYAESLEQRYLMWADNGVKYIVTWSDNSYHDNTQRHRNRSLRRISHRHNKLNVRQAHRDIMYHYQTKYSSYPFTGTLAIADLLRYDIKELYVTGVTFLTDGYYSGYKAEDITDINAYINIMETKAGHPIMPQILFIREFLGDKRFNPSTALRKILEKV